MANSYRLQSEPFLAGTETMKTFDDPHDEWVTRMMSWFWQSLISVGVPQQCAAETDSFRQGNAGLYGNLGNLVGCVQIFWGFVLFKAARDRQGVKICWKMLGSRRARLALLEHEIKGALAEHRNREICKRWCPATTSWCMKPIKNRFTIVISIVIFA